MSVQEVVWTEIIYSVVVVLLELPTGMIADRLSRKHMVLIDSFMTILEFVIIIMATRFWHFAAAITLSGIGHAIQSGAHNALVHDSLKAAHKESTFEKVLGRIRFLDYSGVIIGGLIGGVIAARFPLVTTYWLSLISLVIAFFIGCTLHETKLHTDIEDEWDFTDWKHILGFILHSRSVLTITIVGVITGAALNYVDEFWQIYLQAINTPLALFGIVNVLGFGAVALGSLTVHHLKDRFGFKKSVLVLLVICTLSFLFTSIVQSFPGILGIMAVYFTYAIMQPLFLGYIHEHAIDKYRATIESLYSLIGYLSIVIVGLPFGYISTHYGIFNGFLFLSLVLSLITLLMAFASKSLD